ncbi:MAG: hypothetical protein EOO75_09285 [Myxococcales bacterium]|nr:MAG: hypothetical protein EOO75_09285 [Myxococcales bacterium]
MRRLWALAAVRVAHHGRPLGGRERERWLERWRAGRDCPGLMVTADAAPAQVTLVDPRQVVWPDGQAVSDDLPREVPEGFDVVQIEVRESVAADLRRRAAERGLPVADLLARLVARLDVEAIGTRRAAG